MKRLLIAGILLASGLFAQNAEPPSGGAFLGIDGVVKMVNAGLSDDLIIARLRQDGKAYELSPDDMVKLKAERVSDNVLKVMLDPHAVASTPLPLPYMTSSPQPSGATPPPGVAAVNPNDPLSPHDSGIYLYSTDSAGKPTMTVLERTDYQGSRMGGFLTSAMTYGLAKAKTKAVIQGAASGIRTDENPVFYFYFDDKPAGLGKGLFGGNRLSNPKQFALLRLEVHGKTRETVIGAFSILGGGTGTDSHAMIQFSSAQIRPGLYKVTLNQPLEPGEYCFMASVVNTGAYGAGAAGIADIFDFGFAPGKRRGR